MGQSVLVLISVIPVLGPCSSVVSIDFDSHDSLAEARTESQKPAMKTSRACLVDPVNRCVHPAHCFELPPPYLR